MCRSLVFFRELTTSSALSTISRRTLGGQGSRKTRPWKNSAHTGIIRSRSRTSETSPGTDSSRTPAAHRAAAADRSALVPARIAAVVRATAS
ncbi:hypothetical protein [Actinacidiphila paucisporea]|uniref:Uncharacterized protein n=1 Tax=Actinacidiphila paucisporea TaxID=310782 RepID=A0A1M7NPA6_9ACTN|nr:hypothetical protein SAMN05216499_11987 [Actinacidiphila paucisporea]